MNLHEQAFIEAFVQRARRERALFCLADPKKRSRFVDKFAHHGRDILMLECLRSLQPSQQNPESIYAILRRLGAPDTCHIISESRFDGMEMELLAALKEIVGYGAGTVISCLPGRLGYFEGELRERYLLQR